MNKLYFTVVGRDKMPKDYYRKAYGNFTIVTPLGRINLIHLDCPSPDTIQRRVKEILREQVKLTCNCPICRDNKDQPLDIVYVGENSAMTGLWN